ncbi:dihydrolipoyllysine-residue acetyltransferase [Alkalilimnicola sp. S0819]|uniref:dihydrolipoyllysine-residue acetyltransferase n=1 Tax=Alkalilimnicola sp. S0819 TaxID=2613922 RepID=UPI001261BDE7|nr:dihydrolipoyllysine-residue acetyltransferase [Alkalilimnicola sp. S0819]KAB7627232.1 dihydrolipoyllysine-residue acetyltransferase [Alkalilimnicola sp. S0819]MPQ15945.1 biotin/lipoyl-binding protein [Alkalilimnicola sp. S0819]
MADSVEIKVPDIGDFDAVDVIEVLVSVGDSIEQEQSLLTLESDKATMEVPASRAGKVTEVKVKVGDKVAQGDVIALLEPVDSEDAKEADTPDDQAAARPEADEQAEQPAPEAPSEEASGTEPSEPEPAPSAAGGEPPEHPVKKDHQPLAPLDVASQTKAHASPAVRRFARELGAPLERIQGSGRKGRILKEDVQGFVKQALSGGTAATATPGMGGIPPIPAVDFSKFGEVEKVALSRIKRIAGPHLHRSWLNIPHVTQFDEADITELEAFRKAEKARAEGEGVKLTPLAFMVKASAAALRRYPDFNSSLAPEGDALYYKKYCHIGVAVDTPQGLMVPVIRDADTKGIYDIARDLIELSAKARDGKLAPGDMQGGCFSISSLGGIGGTAFTPIVNAPEVAILGVSRAAMKPVWDGEQFQPRLMLPLSLSYDHRVIDGAAAARFTTYLAELLGDLRRLIL